MIVLGKFQYRDVLLILDNSRAKTYYAGSRRGKGLFRHFSLLCLSRYRLNNFLKGPFDPKEPINQVHFGLSACTGDSLLAKARGLSPRAGGKTVV